MSDKVHKLGIVPLEQTINATTVHILEELLAEARAGTLQEVFVIGRGPSGWSEHASPTQAFPEWIGRLEIQKTNWIAMFNDLDAEDQS